MVFTHVLMSQKDGKFYTGTTGDLNKRLEQHNAGSVFSIKHRLPMKLIYFEACLDNHDAYQRGKYLKTEMGKRFLKNRLSGGLRG